MLKDLIVANRSYRRFFQDESISIEELRQLVELARLSASAANLQPLKYMLFNEPEKNAEIFKHLAWAGYLKDWDGPAEGERPAAYIIVLGDTDIGSRYDWDAGIAAQSILLGAAEKGLGGCMVASVKREALAAALDIAEKYKIAMVIAMGRPREKVVLDEAIDGDIKYWRDEKDVHHVPKRSLEEIIIEPS